MKIIVGTQSDGWTFKPAPGTGLKGHVFVEGPSEEPLTDFFHPQRLECVARLLVPALVGPLRSPTVRFVDPYGNTLAEVDLV